MSHQPASMNNGTDRGYSEVLDGRSILYLYEVGGRTVRLECRIRGKVDQVRKMKNAVFVTLDISAGLQLVFDRELLGDSEFDQSAKLKAGRRIEALVEAQFQEDRSPPVRLIVRQYKTLPSGLIAARRADLGLEQAQSRIELAAIARSIATYLTSENWIEVAPLTISITLDQPVDPLQVIFPGLGAETSLVVSPIAELIEVAQLTGTASVFSISRLYSKAVRDGSTTPESLALVAVHIDPSKAKEVGLSLAEIMVAKGFDPVKGKLSHREREWLGRPWERRQSSAIRQLQDISHPLHEIATLERGIAFRSVWPYPMSLIEGDVRELSEGTLHTMTVHCERLLHVVSGLQYRRLLDSPRLTWGS